jgi:hypothetical protein
MENADSYISAVSLFSSNLLINPVYYIIAGSSVGEGAVVTRYREPEKTDIWPLNSSAADGWFRLVTNYDHWESDPSYDDRRTPGIYSTFPPLHVKSNSFLFVCFTALSFFRRANCS